MAGTMDFFQCQESAHKSTGRLVILFCLAVTGIVLITYLAVALVCIWFANGDRRHLDSMDMGLSLWNPLLMAIVGSAVLLVVGLGTIAKIIQLRSGGRAVAETLGARIIDPNLANPQERQLLNVVEEMAIASGIPVPPVYIVDEEGINACAAGYRPRDAVVIVTRGSVERLNRDELQGVIGHEFSHILNGDMRLNIKLIGVLQGILVIGLAGWYLIQVMLNSGGSRRDSKDSGIPWLLLILGVMLVIIGYVGTFFGNLIKAAVSRQREFLADASAVQFTRNPLGIAGALRKIGGFALGSRVNHHGAAQVSHMFFCQAFDSWLNSLFATHPPLPERILRIDPAWNGKFADGEEPTAGQMTVPEGVQQVANAGLSGGMTAASATASVGQLNKPQLDHAAQLIQQVPESVRIAAREPLTACALVYAMLINDEPEIQSRQLVYLGQQPSSGAATEARRLLPVVHGLDDKHRLPVLDLAMPALRRFSQPQYAEFRTSVEFLAKADGKISLFEWMLQQLVLHNLDAQFTRAGTPAMQSRGLGRLRQECGLLLSMLARVEGRGTAAVQAAFSAGAQRLGEVGSGLQLREAEVCNLDALDAGLDWLSHTPPRVKQQIVEACAATIMADGCVEIQEMELLRGILAILDCPMPPLVTTR